MVERVCREVDLDSGTLKLFEHTELDNEAGAVVWDAALVLLHYFCAGKLDHQFVRCSSSQPTLN